MRSGESFVWISLSKSKSSFRRSKACCWKKEAIDPRSCFRARSRCQAASEFPAIERAYLFGSFARGTFGSDSDVDVRIEYDHGMSFNLHDVSQFGKRIEQATGREVDVVSADRIKKEGLAAAIERDKELVYEREAR